MPQVFKPIKYGMRSDWLSLGALRVCEVLVNAGFRAYIVGGAVRDAMLAISPKDFDIVSDATASQIMRLFPKAIQMDAHFSYVMIKVGSEYFEVTTFRMISSDVELYRHSPSLPGTMAEDAVQRDFTINALYYDPISQEVIDWHGGIPDLREKIIRPIGNPVLRFSENPMSMLRAIRFKHMLGFSISTPASAATVKLASMIRNVSPGRLVAELVRQMLSGKSLFCLREICRANLHTEILPRLARDLGNENDTTFLMQALESVDESVSEGVAMSTGFLFALILWPQVREKWSYYRASDDSANGAMSRAGQTIIASQGALLPLGSQVDQDMQNIWATQPYFEEMEARSSNDLLRHPRFRAGFNLLQLRCESGELEKKVGTWWADLLRGANVSDGIEK